MGVLGGRQTLSLEGDQASTIDREHQNSTDQKSCETHDGQQ